MIKEGEVAVRALWKFSQSRLSYSVVIRLSFPTISNILEWFWFITTSLMFFTSVNYFLEILLQYKVMLYINSNKNLITQNKQQKKKSTAYNLWSQMWVKRCKYFSTNYSKFNYAITSQSDVYYEDITCISLLTMIWGSDKIFCNS